MIQFRCADGCIRVFGELVQRWPDLIRRQVQDATDERYSTVDLLDVQNGRAVVASARDLTQVIDEELDHVPTVEEIDGEEIDAEARVELADGSGNSEESDRTE